MIADFEAENPDIRIVQNQVADADTLIRTLLVKDRYSRHRHLECERQFRSTRRGGGVPRLLRRAGAGDHQPSGAGDPRRPRHLRRRGQRARLRQQRQRRDLQRDDLRRAGARSARDVGRVHRGVRRAESGGHHTVLRHASRLMDRHAFVECPGSVPRSRRLLRQAAGPGNRRRPGFGGVVPEELRRDDGSAVHAVFQLHAGGVPRRDLRRGQRSVRERRGRDAATGHLGDQSHQAGRSRHRNGHLPLPTARTTPTTACSYQAWMWSSQWARTAPNRKPRCASSTTPSRKT